MDDQPAPMADDAEAERGNDPVVVDDTEAERVAAALVDRVDAVGPNRLLGRVGNFTNDNPTAAGLFFSRWSYFRLNVCNECSNYCKLFTCLFRN